MQPKPQDNISAAPPPSESWVYDLAFEWALGYFDENDLALKFDLSPAQLKAVSENTAFKRAVRDYRRQIDDAGDAFRLRAKKSAEIALDVPNRIAHDKTVDPATRLKAVDQLVKYAGWGKDENADTGVTINIKTYAAPSPDGDSAVTINASARSSRPQRERSASLENDDAQAV